MAGTIRAARAQTLLANPTDRGVVDMRLAFIAVTALLITPAYAQFGQPSAFQQRVTEVMQSDIRTDEERARDRDRQAPQVLEFFRLEEDMRVIEILPFSGWYTKILAPILADEGKLYVTHPGPTFYSDAFTPVQELPGMEEVDEIGWGASGESGGTPFFASGTWDVEPVDLVLTFRNYHNFSRDARMGVNDSAFDALKPGGLYGIVDHTRRHMEPDNGENGRRMDPVLVIKEVQEAGFELVDYSTVLRRPDDELRYEVGRPSVTGNSDRFALLFRRPE
jgi:predicted methyltransferase